MEIIDEKYFQIKTIDNKEMKLILRNYNDEELSITIFNINEHPSKKYQLKCNLEEFQKNRFFRIFVGVNEIMKELENKILNSVFIDDTDSIIIIINIGLTVINEILLEIKKQEKNKDEIIQELKEKIEILENKLKESEDKLKLNTIISNDLNKNNFKIIFTLTQRLNDISNFIFVKSENSFSVSDLLPFFYDLISAIYSAKNIISIENDDIKKILNWYFNLKQRKAADIFDPNEVKQIDSDVKMAYAYVNNILKNK